MTTTPEKIILALLKVCPECAGPLLRGKLCVVCAHCGWAHCDDPPKPVPAK